VPDDVSLSARDQFAQLFQQVDTRLAMVGSDRKSLIQVLIYLTDAADLELFNLLWDEWIPEGHAPSRACTITQLAAPGYRAELVVTAAVR
jgi:enamine deaminase RidA (YjgF/YER057c/UK114 family)